MGGREGTEVSGELSGRKDPYEAERGVLAVGSRIKYNTTPPPRSSGSSGSGKNSSAVF